MTHLPFSKKTDIQLAIQVLQNTIGKTEGTYTHQKIKPALNRVIFDLEDMIKVCP